MSNFISLASLKILPRESWLLLFFAGLLCFFAGHHSLKAEADTRRLKQSVEYRVVNFDYNDYKKTDEWKAAVKKQSGDESKARAPFLQKVLNTVAKEGWRLAKVEHLSRQSTLLYFERAK